MSEERPERKRRARRRRPRLLRGLVRLLVVLVCLPLVLVPLYARVDPPWSTLQIWQALRGVDTTRDWVPLDEISPNLVNAVMMSEDGQFCSHNGVDWTSLQEVIESDDDRPRGASTIPMQVAKNLFLWQSRSYVRKGVELPLAYYMDFVWTKRRMMEIYLNIVEWGPGVFGAEAAAQYWFGKSADRLTPGEGARLAVALPNPHVRNPREPGPLVRRLSRIIEQRARQAGAYIGCLESR